MLRAHARARQNVEQRRLAGVRVADDRGRVQLGPPSTRALLVSLRAHLLDLSVEVADPLADAAALDLDLLFAESTARPHSPSAPTDLPVIRIRTDQARQKVVQTGGLDLEPPFMGARMLGKDLEDDLRPVQHSGLEVELEVALLARAQVVVADDQVERALKPQLAERLDLAPADEVRGIDLGPSLHVGTDYLSAGGAREVCQLRHLVADCLGSAAGEHDADEIRALPGGPGRDQSLSVSIRVIASCRRASGAVTDSRK